ncbi:MAG TPA: hypothetical protein PKE29_13405 [Phycisphaerales bacterium]|nr:hypothetical protein [Phycisphaerales bacterium]
MPASVESIAVQSRAAADVLETRLKAMLLAPGMERTQVIADALNKCACESGESLTADELSMLLVFAGYGVQAIVAQISEDHVDAQLDAVIAERRRRERELWE